MFQFDSARIRASQIKQSLEIIMDCHVSITQIGLLYDIAGVFVLALGFLMIGPRDFRNATLIYRAKPNVKKLGYAKVDAWFGVVLIGFGFLGQLLGTLTSFNSWFKQVGAIAPGCLVVVLILYVGCFLFFRGPLAAKVISRSGVKDEDF